MNHCLAKITHRLLPSAAFVFLALASAAGMARPTQFPTALAAFEDMGDYTPEENTLAIESTKPLRIRISPTVAPGDAPKFVEEDVRRAAIYAVLRVFLHTNATQVQVTAVPRLLHVKSGKTEILKFPRASVTVDRSTVEKAVRGELGLSDLHGLVDEAGIVPNMWSKAAKRAMYSDQGAPGAARFSQRLGISMQSTSQR